MGHKPFPVLSQKGDLEAENRFLREVLAIYADKRNWTNDRNWPVGDEGQIVFYRGDGTSDWRTPGWREAEAALTGAPFVRIPEPERPASKSIVDYGRKISIPLSAIVREDLEVPPYK